MKPSISAALTYAINRLSQFGQFRQVSEFFQTTDTKHPASWDSYGYPSQLNFTDYYTMAERSGIGHACVNLTVDKCWQDLPKICEVEGEHEPTAWEREFEQLNNRLQLLHRLKGLDRRQRIARYGGAVLFIAGETDLSKPVGRKFRPQDLLDIRPLYENQLYPTVWDEDFTSPRYGQPLVYQFNEQLLGDKNQHSGRSILVHHTRVIEWAEGADDGTIYGTSCLEAIYNALLDYEKIRGSGGEGFWKNAKSGLAFEIDKDANLRSLNTETGEQIDVVDELNGQVEDFHRGLDQALVTKGMTVKPVQVTLPQPKEFAETALADIAAGAVPPIPITELRGIETGERSSTENASQWAQRNESRRNNFLTPSIIKFINRLVELGFLSKPKNLYVDWQPLQEPSPMDRLERAHKMAQINKDSMGTGVGAVFTAEMIGKEGKEDYESIEDVDLPPLPVEEPNQPG